MTELENDVVIEDTLDEELDTTDDTDYEDNQDDDVTWEQAQEWKKKAQRADKAEKRLVELKKQLKSVNKIEEKNDTTINPRDEVKRILAEEKFYDKNPDAELYKDKITKYQEKGLSLDEAYTLVSKRDKEIEENRNTYGKSIIKGSGVSDGITSVSIDTFDNMTPQAQSDYTSKMTAKHGKVRFK